MFQPMTHQANALNKILNEITSSENGEATGRLVMPTGAGKTAVQAWTLDMMMNVNSKHRVHLVVAPRIALANQLAAEYRNIMTHKPMMLGFNSGDYKGEEGIAWKEESTTSPKVVFEYIGRAAQLNKDLVIFSTYHSVHKLNNIMFDTKIADEAQYTVGEEFFNSYTSVNARCAFTFTATEKFTASDSGRGMNNIAVHGKRIFEVSAAELVEAKVIVAPKLHVMSYDTDENDTIVSEVIEFAKIQIKSAISTLNMPYAKVLYATTGTADIQLINERNAEIRATFPEFDVATCSSREGYVVNGNKMTRSAFMKHINQNKNVLLFHYDMLAEGIDVQGITGVVLMRDLGQAKLVQTIGRAVRLFKAAPELKKYALVSVGIANGDLDRMAYVQSVVEALRGQGFDLTAEDVNVTSANNHMAEEEGELGVEEDMFDSLFSVIKAEIINVINKVEDEENVLAALNMTTDEIGDLFA